MGASFLKQTIEKFRRPQTGPVQFNVAEEISPKVWEDYWSAGQGVGAITEVVSGRPRAPLVFSAASVGVELRPVDVRGSGRLCAGYRNRRRCSC
jgi:nitronate monooxygenase